MSMLRHFTLADVRWGTGVALVLSLASCGFFPGSFQRVVPRAPFEEWVKEALKEEHVSIDRHRMAFGGTLNLSTGRPGMVYNNSRFDVDLHGVTDPVLMERLVQRVRRRAVEGHLQHHARLGFYLDSDNENPKYLIREYYFP